MFISERREFYFFYEISVNRNPYPQPWRDEVADLGQFTAPQAAEVEAAVVDVRGGRGEASVAAVRRQLVELYLQ